jgi:hypothetical protein
MQRTSGFRITRRRFSFWLGMGIFTLGEKLNANGFDQLAAAIMEGSEPAVSPAVRPEHWRVAENGTWRWYERETLINDQWKVTGLTTPINKATGERYTGHTGYLDDSLAPANLRRGESPEIAESAVDAHEPPGPSKPDATRRARHGRPPSKWLRSLRAEELRMWLKTIDVPEAGVSGMTFFEHLTRDHFFDPVKITGLTEDEQAKLHAAAHHGY